MTLGVGPIKVRNSLTRNGAAAMSTDISERISPPEAGWKAVREHARALLIALDRLDVASLSAAQRVEYLTLATRLENIGHARAAATLTVVQVAGDAATLGAGTTTSLLATRVGWAPGRIRSALSCAGVFSEHPEVAAAGCAGELSAAHTGEIARGLQAAETLARRPSQDVARDLLRTARTRPLSELRARVRDLKYAIDSWRAEDDPTYARERSYVKLGATRTGMVRVEALLDPERGALVRTVIEARVAERLRNSALHPDSAATATTGGESEATATEDARLDGQPPIADATGEVDMHPSIGQLAAQALTDVATHYLDCDLFERHLGGRLNLTPL